MWDAPQAVSLNMTSSQCIDAWIVPDGRASSKVEYKRVFLHIKSHCLVWETLGQT